LMGPGDYFMGPGDCLMNRGDCFMGPGDSLHGLRTAFYVSWRRLCGGRTASVRSRRGFACLGIFVSLPWGGRAGPGWPGCCCTGRRTISHHDALLSTYGGARKAMKILSFGHNWVLLYSGPALRRGVFEADAFLIGNTAKNSHFVGHNRICEYLRFVLCCEMDRCIGICFVEIPRRDVSVIVVPQKNV
jgi:hypothetical protein